MATEKMQTVHVENGLHKNIKVRAAKCGTKLRVYVDALLRKAMESGK